MAWKYKDDACECGAVLAGVAPIRPVLNVQARVIGASGEPVGQDKSIANCPECSRTPEIVELCDEEPEAEEATEAEPAAAAEPAAEPEG